MKILKVKIKNVYGKDLIYPACKDSELFAQLIGQTTLGSVDQGFQGGTENISIIKQLGYDLEIITEIKL